MKDTNEVEYMPFAAQRVVSYRAAPLTKALTFSTFFHQVIIDLSLNIITVVLKALFLYEVM